MIVLSLFDGMSCGQIALNRLGIKVKRYYASEIKKHAIKITQYNYPKTIQVGDIRYLTYKNGILYNNEFDQIFNAGKIDLLMGGSPCQDFSNLKITNDSNYGLLGEKSRLFFEYYRLLKECNPKYFFLENVKMKKESKKIIDEYLGVIGILINSNLVSAQNRNRYYWTNIKNVKQPRDKGIILKDILENDYEILKNYKLKNTPSRIKMWNSKCKNITDSFKSSCLTTKMDRWNNAGLIKFDNFCRFLTPLECERLQTVPDNYTKLVSKNKRYDLLGDGWTIDVIVHIFNKLLKDGYKLNKIKGYRKKLKKIKKIRRKY